jgi:hypothetical protein
MRCANPTENFSRKLHNPFRGLLPGSKSQDVFAKQQGCLAMIESRSSKACYGGQVIEGVEGKSARYRRQIIEGVRLEEVAGQIGRQIIEGIEGKLVSFKGKLGGGLKTN